MARQAPDDKPMPGHWKWPPFVPPKLATPTYTPPPELVADAEHALTWTTPDELALAERAYTACCGVTGTRSTVTEAQLPVFGVAPSSSSRWTIGW